MVARAWACAGAVLQGSGLLTRAAASTAGAGRRVGAGTASPRRLPHALKLESDGGVGPAPPTHPTRSLSFLSLLSHTPPIRHARATAQTRPSLTASPLLSLSPSHHTRPMAAVNPDVTACCAYERSAADAVLEHLV